MSKKRLRIKVNSVNHTLETDPSTPLLYVLRNQLNIHGPKYGCGLGQCGSCVVLIDNQPVISCMLPVSSTEGKEVTTLAGLLDQNGTLHPVQRSFLKEQAAQCGYCTSGMILSSVALLHDNPEPSIEEIRAALHNHLCRCGTQPRVIRAIRTASEMIKDKM